MVKDSLTFLSQVIVLSIPQMRVHEINHDSQYIICLSVSRYAISHSVDFANNCLIT